MMALNGVRALRLEVGGTSRNDSGLEAKSQSKSRR